jgi:hypothetical protein
MVASDGRKRLDLDQSDMAIADFLGAIIEPARPALISRTEHADLETIACRDLIFLAAPGTQWPGKTGNYDLRVRPFVQPNSDVA